jgi:transcriptional regulator with XRE-family HTH domain
MFGEILRNERERAGLSRGELRLRILRYWETSPSVNAIRDLENGSRSKPHPHNLIKLYRVLSTLNEALEKAKAEQSGIKR